MTITVSKNERGLMIGKFTDRYGMECSIQESSLATDTCLWLGLDAANPQIMAKDAAAHGVDPGDGTGWVPYPIPKEVQLATRMHLTREMARDLIPLLESFARSGLLPNESPPAPLNEAQTVCARTYAGGEFAHLVEEPTTWRGFIDSCGDTLFRFMMLELSDGEDCHTIGEGHDRITRARDEVEGVMLALDDLDDR